MKTLTILLCIFTCLCSATLAGELDPDKFMSIDEIKPGMKGIGKTVFEGTKIDEFQVEVLDVVKNAVGPKCDIIWVLCSGGPLEETGVLSGMSGSPVYIDGKLIGAVAYRLGQFAKQPIAGVTPIASMRGGCWIFDKTVKVIEIVKIVSRFRRLDGSAGALHSRHPVSSIQYPGQSCVSGTNPDARYDGRLSSQSHKRNIPCAERVRYDPRSGKWDVIAG